MPCSLLSNILVPQWGLAREFRLAAIVVLHCCPTYYRSNKRTVFARGRSFNFIFFLRVGRIMLDDTMNIKLDVVDRALNPKPFGIDQNIYKKLRFELALARFPNEAHPPSLHTPANKMTETSHNDICFIGSTRCSRPGAWRHSNICESGLASRAPHH